MILQDLVIDAARRAPNSLAVASPERSLTYAELDTLADRFADALRARNVRPGDRVILWSGKSALAVAFMQGALRAGAVYVPVNGTNPADRVARIASDSQAALVAADDSVSAGGGPGLSAPGTVIPLADLLAEARTRSGRRSHRPDPDSAAYILYTSGSTGMPKGVCLSHRNALAFIDWAVETLEVSPEDRLSNHAPFNFDLSVFDLYAAFRAGASVHLVPSEAAYAPRRLVEFVHEQRITVWYSVPSVLALMMREADLLDQPQPPHLRACVFAGEPFAIGQVQALRKGWPTARLLNWYGPTETNVCTSYEVTDADLARTGPLPIGTACSGDRITLDPGPEKGEIVVSGPSVMLGYWGRAPHTGAYRTGDIGRVGPDGCLEYAGRIDHMVKIRGNRVELGEIEAVVVAHPAVSDATVLLVGSGLEARLHAVVVAAEDSRPRLLDLKKFCSERLPTYMLPDLLHVVDALPLTPNGKTNRSALAAAIEGGELR